jgi:redox-sensitive bicupin YhaK (pirin superfamily)
VTRIVRADQRYRSSHDGVESWHCFAAGAHYDPDNVAFGALVGFDEHLVAPGAGFDWHAHRGVEIVSHVVSGTLRHEDESGVDRFIEAGEVFAQSAVGGIRHRETNPSSSQPLRLVQMTVLSPSSARYETWLGAGAIDAPLWHAFVLDGAWTIDANALHVGDSARGAGRLVIDGDGVLLVWLL